MAEMTVPAEVVPSLAGVRRLALPRLSRPAMDRCNRIAAAAGVVDAPFGSLALRIQVLPFGAKMTCDWCFEFQAGSELVRFHAPHALLVHLLRAHEPSLVLEPAPPAGLLTLLADTLLQPGISAWQRWAGRRVRFIELRASQAIPDSAATLAFSAAGQTWHGALSGAAVVDQLLATWPASPHPLSQLPLPARLWAGSTDLPAAVVASLRPGDAVLIEFRPRNGLMLRVAEGWAASVRQNGGKVLLTEAIRPLRASDMETKTSMAVEKTEPGSSDLDSLEAVPVRLSFDVGQVELPLGEVRRLQAGSILPLGRGLAELVEISANGRRVGAGELVEIEGTPAVRITRLFGVG